MTKKVNGIEVDSEKINGLLKWVIAREEENIRTRERNDTEMAKFISKRIEEVEKCY
jgi:hypothetical protein